MLFDAGCFRVVIGMYVSLSSRLRPEYIRSCSDDAGFSTTLKLGEEYSVSCATLCEKSSMKKLSSLQSKA